MKKLVAFLLLQFFLSSTDAQTLCLENIYHKDLYPQKTLEAGLLKEFDFLISLKGYSNWSEDRSVKLLGRNFWGWWYKIEINTSNFNTDSSTIVIKKRKIQDSIGKTIFDVLNQNNLFTMKDERDSFFVCPPKRKVIGVRDGKEIVALSLDVDDGSEYAFEIWTRNQYKKLYFYEPKEYYSFYECPAERMQIINCINVFEKYLGN